MLLRSRGMRLVQVGRGQTQPLSFALQRRKSSSTLTADHTKSPALHQIHHKYDGDPGSTIPALRFSPHQPTGAWRCSTHYATGSRGLQRSWLSFGIINSCHRNIFFRGWVCDCCSFVRNWSTFVPHSSRHCGTRACDREDRDKVLIQSVSPA